MWYVLHSGEDMDDYVTLKKVEPAAYRVFFGEDEGVQSLDLLYDVQKMCLQLEQVEEGAGGAFLRFLANAKEALDKVFPEAVSCIPLSSGHCPVLIN